MRDLSLDPATDDLVLVAGRLSLTSGTSAVRQKVLIRLRLCLGEWFLDTGVGVPWFQQILGRKNATEVARSVLYSALATCPGVAEVLKFDLSVVATTRAASLSFTARTVDGDTFDVTDFRPTEVR